MAPKVHVVADGCVLGKPTLQQVVQSWAHFSLVAQSPDQGWDKWPTIIVGSVNARQERTKRCYLHEEVLANHRGTYVTANDAYATPPLLLTFRPPRDCFRR